MDRLLGMHLYPIYMGDVPPHYTIRKAFQNNFSPFVEYDWVNASYTLGLQKTQEHFLAMLERDKPEYTFMQLQNSVNMNVPMIREMAKHTKIINWTGDVRQTKEWYDWFEAIGREIFLTLFTNETDVEVLRARGVRTDYLQVSADDGWYKKRPKAVALPEIVFCANHAPQFPLGQYRLNVVRVLKQVYGERFQVFGHGWHTAGVQTRFVGNAEEALIYSNAKICLSVSSFNLKRYHSDRLLRIMACGSMAMSHDFQDYQKDFTDGHDIVVFKNLQDLVEKCDHYLLAESERKVIAENGYNNFREKRTWDARCKELIQILKKYDGAGVL